MWFRDFLVEYDLIQFGILYTQDLHGNARQDISRGACLEANAGYILVANKSVLLKTGEIKTMSRNVLAIIQLWTDNTGGSATVSVRGAREYSTGKVGCFRRSFHLSVFGQVRH